MYMPPNCPLLGCGYFHCGSLDLQVTFATLSERPFLRPNSGPRRSQGQRFIPWCLAWWLDRKKSMYIHVYELYIYLHLVDFVMVTYGKCRKIYQSHGWYGSWIHHSESLSKHGSKRIRKVLLPTWKAMFSKSLLVARYKIKCCFFNIFAHFARYKIIFDGAPSLVGQSSRKTKLL